MVPTIPRPSRVSDPAAGRGGAKPRSLRMNGRLGTLGTLGFGPTPFPSARPPRPPARVGRAGKPPGTEAEMGWG